MHLKIKTKPIPQPRHRVSRYGAYIPKSHPVHAYKALVRSEAMKCGEPVSTNAVRIKAVFSVPQLKTRKQKHPMSKSQGDIDNLFKSVTDALTGIAYEDDSQICEVEMMKRIGEPCVEIIIEEIVK